VTGAAHEFMASNAPRAGRRRIPARVMQPLLAVLVLAVVGGGGIATGVAIDRMMITRDFGGRSQFHAAQWMMQQSSAEARQRVSDRFAHNLDLTPDQRVRIDSIIARQMGAADALRQEYMPRVRAIMMQTRAAVDSILTPAQRDRLKSMSRRGV
jgi:hypothetical protein